MSETSLRLYYCTIVGNYSQPSQDHDYFETSARFLLMDALLCMGGP